MVVDDRDGGRGESTSDLITKRNAAARGQRRGGGGSCGRRQRFGILAHSDRSVDADRHWPGTRAAGQAKHRPHADGSSNEGAEQVAAAGRVCWLCVDAREKGGGGGVRKTTQTGREDQQELSSFMYS
eukprot:GHVU01135196.1.p1 GENE.GHVU01135196.1~~GHVU01135196.1.p1  ORF type:complete len:127 (+),score=13.40 GHVU01135196.1:343-723(+)